MAQETAIAYGIEFYVGRRSRDRAVSDVRAAGELVNQASSTAFKKGAQERQQQHDVAVNELRRRSKTAHEQLAKARTQAAKQATKQFEAMKPPSVANLEAQKGRKLSTKELEDYSATFGRELRGMDSAMKDFASRSSDMGVKLGTGADVAETMGKFSKADVQDRSRVITDLESQQKINKDILKISEKEAELQKIEADKAEKKNKQDKKDLANAKKRLAYHQKLGHDTKEHVKTVEKLTKKEKKSEANLKKQVKLKQDLIKEMMELEDLTEGQRKLLTVLLAEQKKLTAEERKYGKIQREIKEEERKLDRELMEWEKKNILNLKEKNRLMQEYSRHIDEAAEKVGSTLKNAFVIGTAAIAALNYKLMAVVSSLQDFEAQLINANSIWQESNETLFEISDSVVEFGTKFGVEMTNATSGLYQYASAGVDAAEAMQMLQHTLKLSMAVQGDHNTLSKLTTQTIMGFNMEFSQAEEVTDKFAHAINKSLIEWDDLASSIKFALPFFISTGQSIDQLLGGLQVLTNRALEAGIAGRGLRQALAEFTQHAEDNAAAFRKMGIEILDLEGNMKPLNIIATEFQDVMGEGVSDMEVMIALMEDLNVRGATAFIHLVQNADEFTGAVNDLANSAGSAHQMAMVQQEALVNQIQVLKTSMMAPFILSDKIGAEAGYLNQFAMEIHGIVDVVENLFVKTMEDGSVVLTEMSEIIRDFVIGALRQGKEVLVILVQIIKDFTEQGHDMTGMLHAAAIPLKLVLKLAQLMGDGFFEAIIAYKILNGLIPINSAILATNLNMMMAGNAARFQEAAINEVRIKSGKKMIMVTKTATGWEYANGRAVSAKSTFDKIDIAVTNAKTQAIDTQNVSAGALLKTQMMSKMVMFGAMYLTQKIAKDSWVLAGVIGGLAGAYMGYAIALQMVAAGQLEVKAGGTLMGTHGARILGWGFAAGAAFNILMQQMMKPSTGTGPDIAGIDTSQSYASHMESAGTSMDTGGRYMARRTMDIGGYTQDHGMAMLQKGETIIPKTQNMLSGGASGGITLNIHGDVYDSDNFAEKISEVLPMAVRKSNDVGGI